MFIYLNKRVGFLICLIFLFFICLSCDKEKEKEQNKLSKPNVVSQKISIDKPSAPAQPVYAAKIVDTKQPQEKQTTTVIPTSAVTTPATAIPKQITPPKEEPKTELKKEDKKVDEKTQKTEESKSDLDFKPELIVAFLAKEKDRYNPAGKIDPFEPFIKKRQAQAVLKKTSEARRVPLTPIEMVDISQLKLSAIVISQSGNIALVEEASGKGYTIQKDTYIGVHSGKVKEILKDKVIVEEEIQDIFGNIKMQERELKLQKPVGED
ncbi:MAG: pilus assembly protein PilP [Desulfobacterales bacterium]|nr:pilus assembly protein PilP [Desulfobacterales bacterium]